MLLAIATVQKCTPSYKRSFEVQTRSYTEGGTLWNIPIHIWTICVFWTKLYIYTLMCKTANKRWGNWRKYAWKYFIVKWYLPNYCKANSNINRSEFKYKSSKYISNLNNTEIINIRITFYKIISFRLLTRSYRLTCLILSLSLYWYKKEPINSSPKEISQNSIIIEKCRYRLIRIWFGMTYFPYQT